MADKENRWKDGEAKRRKKEEGGAESGEEDHKKAGNGKEESEKKKIGECHSKKWRLRGGICTLAGAALCLLYSGAHEVQAQAPVPESVQVLESVQVSELAPVPEFVQVPKSVPVPVRKEDLTRGRGGGNAEESVSGRMLADAGAAQGTALLRGPAQIKPKLLERFSAPCDAVEQLPDPEPFLLDEQGRRFVLKERSVEPLPVTGRREMVNGTVIYRSVDRLDEIPGTAEIEIEDAESKKTIWAPLPLDHEEYQNERWEDFQFTVTVHTYGADWYLMGDERIEGGGKEPDLEQCGDKLLGLIGMQPEDARVERCQWNGSPYEDGEGILCRDATAFGRKRVFDCHAVYRGEAELPNYNRYRLKTIYEPEIQAAESGEALPPAESAQAAEENPEESWWGRLSRVAKTVLVVTVSLVFLLLLLSGLYVLVQAARRIGAKEREERRLDK